MCKLKDLKKGEWFTKKPIMHPNENQVFIRGDYCRELKKYSVIRYSDMNDEQFIKGDKEVFTDFIF